MPLILLDGTWIQSEIGAVINADSVEAALRALGHSLTPQRRAVLRHLDGNLEHPTAAAIFAAITRDFPVTSRATVYNTLQLLTELGAVRVLQLEGEDELRYDPNTSLHHHLRCTSCGRLEDIAGERVEVRLDGQGVAAEARFSGHCSACATATPPPLSPR